MFPLDAIDFSRSIKARYNSSTIKFWECPNSKSPGFQHGFLTFAANHSHETLLRNGIFVDDRLPGAGAI